MKKDYILLGLLVALILFAMMACSSDSSDDDNLLNSELCHAWYWHDEMPKNYYDLIVYKSNGRFEVVAMITTDHGIRKKITNQGNFRLDGDRLTVKYDDRDERFTYRIVIEKNEEGGLTMYKYSDGEETQSWYNTYYTSDRIDDAYRNTPTFIQVFEY